MPSVSVVIPVFNGERYVADAIRSVLDQSRKDLECIVVDDGSTDRTPEIIGEFGPPVRHVRTENRGVAAARNRGAREASTSLIAFLDADDAWVPRKLATQLAVLDRMPEVQMVCSSVFLADERLRVADESPVIEGPDALNELLTMEKSLHVPMTAVVRRGAFSGVGGFDETLSTSADFDFACRVALRGPIVGLPAPLALYRRHEGQMHRQVADRTESEMAAALDRLFSSPSLPCDLRGERRKADASLYFMLARHQAHHRDARAAARYLTRAALADPVRAAGLSVRAVRGRRARAARSTAGCRTRKLPERGRRH